MWNKLARAVSFILGLAILGAIGYGLYIFIKEASQAVASIDKTVGAAIIAASATIIASTIAITVGKIYELRLHVEKENRDKKIPVYEDLLKFMFRNLNSSNTSEPLEDPEVLEFMKTFNQRFIVWASDKVIASWVKWRRHISNEIATQARPHEGLFLLEEVMFAIRQDLGYPNKKVATGDILALFINDIDVILPRE
jgi:hypothetical protein